ncbi:hypothetical protein [Sapientia aquatica]|uniref:hypothetical protein n=1 Tax=Sapientia aquatica TaxID=1549640 RepID=UPI00197E5F06|nr:hypothetical protein [Sapientia aquatica]
MVMLFVNDEQSLIAIGWKIMSYYGITKISWDKSHGFVKQVILHKMSRNTEDSRIFGLDAGTKLPYYEVASLIDKGNHVYVMLNDGPGSYKADDGVGVMPGYQEEYIESVDEAGNPTGALFDLPAWIEK